MVRASTTFCFFGIVSSLLAAEASADELKVLAVTEMTSAFQQIIPGFVNSSSHRVVVEYGSAHAIRNRILQDEKTDIVFVTEVEWPQLVKGNKFDKPTAIASFGLGLGVQPGRLASNMRDLTALKKALQAATTIGVVNPQAHEKAARLNEMLQRHRLLENLAPKLKTYNSWFALAAALSRGDVEVGFAPTLNLAEAGVNFDSKLPPEIQKAEVVSAGVAIDTIREDAARAFIRFFRRSQAEEVLKTTGLEPVHSIQDWSVPQSAAQEQRAGDGAKPFELRRN